MKIVEITRESRKVAWELTVIGDEKVEELMGAYNYGWTSYSAERMYDSPLVYNVTCVEDRNNNVFVSFVAQNRFKQNYDGDASVIIHDAKGNLAEKVDFTFNPYMMPTDVDLTFMAGSSIPICGGGKLRVVNQWSDEKVVYL